MNAQDMKTEVGHQILEDHPELADDLREMIQNDLEFSRVRLNTAKAEDAYRREHKNRLNGVLVVESLQVLVGIAIVIALFNI